MICGKTFYRALQPCSHQELVPISAFSVTILQTPAAVLAHQLTVILQPASQTLVSQAAIQKVRGGVPLQQEPTAASVSPDQALPTDEPSLAAQLAPAFGALTDFPRDTPSYFWWGPRHAASSHQTSQKPPLCVNAQQHLLLTP